MHAYAGDGASRRRRRRNGKSPGIGGFLRTPRMDYSTRSGRHECHPSENSPIGNSFQAGNTNSPTANLNRHLADLCRQGGVPATAQLLKVRSLAQLRRPRPRSTTSVQRRVRPIDAGPKPQLSPTQTEARRRGCPGRNGQGRRQSRGADLGWAPRVTISFSLDANENDKSSPKSQSWRSLISMAQRSARPLALIFAAPGRRVLTMRAIFSALAPQALEKARFTGGKGGLFPC